MGAEEGTGNADALIASRSDLKYVIQDLQALEQTCVPPAVQEVVLARRAVEDARMRLGVTLAYVNGKDPLENA